MPSRLLVLAAGLAAASTLQLPVAARAATGTEISTNWAGYAATGGRFRQVTGSWRVPTASCSAGGSSFSAQWLGLGGFAQTSRALEQTGTEVDCNRFGRAVYSAWYELVPDVARTIRGLAVHAGDRMTASVQVRGKRVALTLRNRTTGARSTRIRLMSKPDVSSAEWILEAPTGCDRAGSCQQLPLADFGAVPFTQARATATSGHGGVVADPVWSATKLQLSQTSHGGALASELGPSGAAFTVTYAQSVNGFGKARARVLPSRRATG